MNFSEIFSSPALKALSRDLLAALIFDAAQAPLPPADRRRVEGLFLNSLKAAAGNVLRSAQTHQRLLEKLQRVELLPAMARLRRGKGALAPDYFEKQFSQVISPRTARRVVPGFLDEMRCAVAACPPLADQVIHSYRGALRRAAENSAAHSPELRRVLERLEQLHPEEKSGFIAVNHRGSAQLPHWQSRRWVRPLRGLRHLEERLSAASRLHLTGSPGCGKTILLSAWLHGLVSPQRLSEPQFFYYRFTAWTIDPRPFEESLIGFLEKRRPELSREEIRGYLPFLAAESGLLMIFDDLHNIRGAELRRLISQIWEAAGDASFSGRLIMAERSGERQIIPASGADMHYPGLSTAESRALLSENWRMQLSREAQRAVAAAMKGHPVHLLLFRNWWQVEKKPDTALQSFLKDLPAATAAETETPPPAGAETQTALSYIFNCWFEACGRAAERFNRCLTAASIFRIPESEEFWQAFNPALPAGPFSEMMEKLVDEFQLIEYDDHLARYHFPDYLRERFYRRIPDARLKRIWHKSAGELYRRRTKVDQRAALAAQPDVVEGAHHFLAAEREEEGLRLILAGLAEGEWCPAGEYALLEILNATDFNLITDAALRSEAFLRRGSLLWRNGETAAARRDWQSCAPINLTAPLSAELLHCRARAALADDDLPEAIALLETSLQHFSEAGSAAQQAAVLRELGGCYRREGRSKPAVEAFSRAYQLFRQANLPAAAIEATLDLADDYLQREDFSRAEQLINRARSEADSLHDPDWLALTREAQARLQWRQGETATALVNLQSALLIRRKQQDWSAAAALAEQIGQLSQVIEEHAAAQEALQQAAGYCRKSGDLRRLVSVYGHLGQLHSAAHAEAAMDYFQKAQEICEGEDDRQGMARLFVQMAAGCARRRDWERALDLYDRALELLEQLETPSEMAQVYHDISAVYVGRGEDEHALKVLERAAELQKEAGELCRAAGEFLAMARILQKNQEWKQAVEMTDAALEIFSGEGHSGGQAAAFLEKGIVLQKQGDAAAAEHAFQESEDLAARSGHHSATARARFHLATVRHDRGDYDSALELYEAARKVFERQRDWYHLARCLGNISAIEFEHQNYQAALLKQAEILLFFRSREAGELAEKVLANLSACQQRLGSEAFQGVLNQCLETVSHRGVVWGEQQLLSAQQAAQMTETAFYDI